MKRIMAPSMTIITSRGAVMDIIDLRLHCYMAPMCFRAIFIRT